MKFCTRCGNQLQPDVRFCASCGPPTPIATKNFADQAGRSQTSRNVGPDLNDNARDGKLPNSQRRIVNVWLFITLIFLIGIFLPSWIGTDAMGDGFGLSLLSGFFALIGLIVVFIYRSRAKQMDKILSGEGRIAYWHYAPEEWFRFVVVDFEEEREMKRNMFFLVAGISFIVGIVLAFLVEEPMLILIIIAGIILLVSIPAYFVPRYRFRTLKNSKAEAIISKNGVLVGKMFHLWIGMGARLDRVSINVETDPKMLEFSYSMPTKNGRQHETARVPVPQGKIDEAIAIAESINHHQI